MTITTTPGTPSWEQLSGLRPRLRPGVRVHRHLYRGVPWYVVQDPATGRHVRLGHGAWRVAQAMTGEHTLEEIHDALEAGAGDETPDEAFVVQILLDLHRSELLECDELSNARDLAARQRRHERLRWRRLFASPVSQRVPLLDPQAWLDRHMALVRPVFTRAGLLLWLAALAWGLWLATTNWPDIARRLSGDVLGPHSLALFVLAYLFVKTLHEFGHAFATRIFGGEVHEMGVMFLVFLPVPYVDASASSAFPEKSRRIVVGAAGIMVEGFLSVLALWVALTVEPGLTRDFALSVVLVAGLSTLLFNGNPLLRFDGYYVLCDAVEIPNLGTRATRYLGYLVQRYLCGAREAVSPVSAPGERGWFIGYGIAATLYRIGLLIAIGLYVATLFPVVGTVLVIWLALAQGVVPVVRGLRGFIAAPVLAGRRVRAAVVTAAPVLLVAGVALALPLPAWTYAEGVVWLPERAQVRAGVDGFVERQLADSGATVAPGDPLFALDGAATQSRAAMLERRLEEQQARYDAALFHDRASIAGLRQQLISARAELDEARARAGELVVASPHGGRLVVPQARRLTGRFVRQGELLGFVADDRPQTAKVVVRQGEIDRVRDATHAVRVRIAGDLRGELAGRIEAIVPSAVHVLPSAALGAPGGGRIAVSAHDPSGQTPAESVFLVDVTLPADAPRLPPGTRVYLRFEHGGATLAAQLARGVRQLLLTRFGV